MPSTWLAKPKTMPDWSASTVFLAITDARAEQLDLAQLGAAPAERLEGDVDAGGDRAADVLARAALTTSKVVAVPKSTTIAGPAVQLWRRRAR